MLIDTFIYTIYPAKNKSWMLVNKVSRGGHYTLNFNSVIQHRVLVSPFKEKMNINQNVNTLIRG